MIQNQNNFSINNKFIIGLFTLVLVIVGSYSLYTLPIDALPDITNNQVQIITSSPTLATQEVEQFITYPIEQSVKSIPNVVELRSISRFGLSVVTVVFEDGEFEAVGIDLQWTDVPEGTGKMCQMLRDGETDIAVILTEGIEVYFTIVLMELTSNMVLTELR